MITLNKLLLASAVAATMVTGFAHAASAPVAGNGVAASADVVFSEPDQISHTLTPVANLFAGEHQDLEKIADGVVHSLDGVAHLYVVRFTGASSYSSGYADIPSAIYPGKNNPDNTINVEFGLKNIATNNSANQYMDSTNHGLVLYGRQGIPAAAKTVNYEIILNKKQTIKADTYTISTVAYEYAG